MNAYEMLAEIRDNIGEGVAAHWSDRALLRKLNMSHRIAAERFLVTNDDWFLTTASIVASNSLIALPSDCVHPVYMEGATDGYEIPIRGTVRERRMTRMAGTTLSDGMHEAYFRGSYLEVNTDNFAETVTLWYQPRIPDLHAGELGSGTSATALIFDKDNWPSGVNDYYNNAYVEVVDVSDSTNHGRFLVSDYVGSTATATVTGASAVAGGDYYGTLSQLPDEAHPFVLLDATIKALAKPGSTLDKEVFAFFSTLHREASRALDAFVEARLHNSRNVRIREMGL